MKRLKIGIIGAGFIGKQHIDAIKRIPGAEIVALSDVNEKQGRATCEEFFIPHFYNDYMELITKEKPDVIHNCTPNHLHYEICKNVIESGINIYCEKPLANSSKETAELCSLAQKMGVFAAVNFNYRQNAMVREMHECVNNIDEDSLENWGRTFLIRGHYLQDWMMYDTDYNWRCVPELGGISRTIADIGSHCFDTLQYITGKKIIRVFADLETVIDQRKKFAETKKTFESGTSGIYELVKIESEDAAFIIVEFEDGVKGQLTVSQVTAGHKNDLVISIDGSNYSMTWEQENADKLNISHRKNGNTMKFAGADMLHGDAVRYATLPAGHPVGWCDAMKNSIYEFYSTVSDKKPVNYATFQDADYIVKIVEACLKSAEEKCWMQVEA